MNLKILTYDNGVGIVTDGELLTSLIKNNTTSNAKMEFIDKFTVDNSDVGIWIQNFDINLMNHFEKNIFFINEEWSGDYEINNLHLFDYVVCKTKYAKELLCKYKNVICLPFISRDYYLNVERNKKYLHFAGRSIQKNTELILKQRENITLIDPYNLHRCPDHFVHINKYQTQTELQLLLNTHDIHLCTSLYESWGHYLFEGLSTGNEIICSDIPAFKENLDPDLVHFLPTKIQFDYSYTFDKQTDNKQFPFRISYHIDETCLKDIIDNFKPIGRNEERRKLYNSITYKNKIELLNFFNNL